MSKETNDNYKKKPCKSFFRLGFCPYGSRCNFKHGMKSVEECELPFYEGNLLIGTPLKLYTSHPRQRLSCFTEFSTVNETRQNLNFQSDSSFNDFSSPNESSSEDEKEARKSSLNSEESKTSSTATSNSGDFSAKETKEFAPFFPKKFVRFFIPTDVDFMIDFEEKDVRKRSKEDEKE